MTHHASRHRKRYAGSDHALKPADAVGKRFIDRTRLAGRDFVHIHPGDIHYSAQPTAISTLLGSCVAVCLWDPEVGVGGITHYVLPDSFGRGEFSTRFGRVAVSVLVENLAALGASIPRLMAKIVGGGNVVSAIPAEGSVGERNIVLARSLLADLAIPVVSEDTGGTSGRVLVFFTDNGVALVRKV